MGGQAAGVVEVSYLEECPAHDEGPFLKGERLLIDAVAERIGRVVERIRAQEQLRVERSALAQSNIAMRQVMARVQEEKMEVAGAVQSNVDKIVMPILHALEEVALPQQKGYLSLLQRNLQEIASPFANKISRAFMGLTPAEVRICDVIRRGMATKEIAHLQSISPATVSRHREHIRRKFDLTNQAVNLTTYLNTFMAETTTQPARTRAEPPAGVFRSARGRIVSDRRASAHLHNGLEKRVSIRYTGP